jgi:hypothetical protein
MAISGSVAFVFWEAWSNNSVANKTTIALGMSSRLVDHDVFGFPARTYRPIGRNHRRASNPGHQILDPFHNVMQTDNTNQVCSTDSNLQSFAFVVLSTSKQDRWEREAGCLSLTLLQITPWVSARYPLSLILSETTHSFIVLQGGFCYLDPRRRFLPSEDRAREIGTGLVVTN